MRRWQPSFSLLWFVCLGLAPACHDENQHDDPGGGSAGAPTTEGVGGTGIPDPVDHEAIDRFFSEYAASVCVMYRPCCLSEGLGYDGAGCMAWFREVLESRLAGEFKAEAAEHCLVALADANAQDSNRCGAVRDFDEATLRPECSAAFMPLARSGAALGEECSFAFDCANSPLGEVTCFESRCLLERPGGVDEGPCLLDGELAQSGASEAVTCAPRDGLYCDLEHNACAMLGDVGDECTHIGSCKPEAICLSDHCKRLPLRGEACLATSPALCALGSSCDDESWTCGVPLPAGEACENSYQCSSGSCLRGVCAGPEFFTQLSCTGAD
jgi:hypothetical protein